ncbi:zinc-ribbon domain-containing protein [Halorubrum sp. Atlit-26R]|uniref:zinc-ribbon domain-containing protein n=1 Tax=Halorubrum sp. Atlit-26R TaxID=2282128 RepID=UPI0011C3C6D7|nr:zinc-ribbon domain-containing protein [Halorubrum sp. Atlit-26R]
MSSDSDKSVLEEAVNDVIDDDEDFDPDEVSELKGVLLGAGIAVIFGGILGALLNMSEPISGFVGGATLFAILGAIVVVAIASDGEIGNLQQQQQQLGDNSQPTVVCTNCGWKNPKSNNYCHDCGESLED